MKVGEVAVENSVNAIRDHKGGKLKERGAMPQHYAAYPQYQHHIQQQPQLVSYPQHLYAPFQLQYQPQPFAALPTYAQPLQPVPTYQRYGAPMHSYSSGNAATSGGLLHQFHQQTPQQYSQHGGVKRSIKYTSQQPQQALAPAPASAPAPSLAHSSNSSTTHRGKIIQEAKIPQSAPTTTTQQDNSGPVWPATASSNQPGAQRQSRRSLHDDDFPSLSKDGRSYSREKPGRQGKKHKSPGSNQSPERIARISPSKPLVFRDAVLKQQSKAADEERQQSPSPSKSLTNSDGGSSDHTEDEELSKVSNQSPTSHRITPRPDRLKSGRIHARDDRGGDHVKEETVYTHAGPQRADNNVTNADGTATVIQSKTPTPRHRTQSLEPELGQHGYSVHPSYLSHQAYRSDDSAAFSALSHDVFEFVKRIDAKLRSLSTHQQRAIAKLQEVIQAVWSDSAIDIYGSNYTRLALPLSDVDCVVSVPSQAHGAPSKVLREIADQLRRQHWAVRIELLDSAKIPVLKVVYSSSAKSRTEVKLDLTCAHSAGHSGLSARDLIYSYQVAMPALRPLALILKSHIQRRELNCAYSGGLSSYGLVLLVIRFLQACGDEHQVADDNHRDNGRGRSVSENNAVLPSGSAQPRFNDDGKTPPIYEFSRDGKLTWRTGLGNLLLLFLETYVTFDYCRFGIAIENAGEYFPLPADKISLDAGAVVSPYIVDPIKTTRSIGNCFRMHEVIQAWYTLYHQITNGVPLEDAINHTGQAAHSV